MLTGTQSHPTAAPADIQAHQALFAVGDKVRFTDAYLGRRFDYKRSLTGRVGEVTEVRENGPTVVFPKEGRRKSYVFYEVPISRLLRA